MSDVNESRRSLTKNERGELIAHVAHKKWANRSVFWANHSFFTKPISKFPTLAAIHEVQYTKTMQWIILQTNRFLIKIVVEVDEDKLVLFFVGQLLRKTAIR